MRAPQGLVEAAQQFMVEGKPKEAVEALQAIVEKYPEDEFARRTLEYVGLAEAAGQLLAEGRSTEAIGALEAIVEKFPHDGSSLSRLETIYREVGREVDSLRLLERVIAENPQSNLVRSAAFSRGQIAIKILDGVPPNGDGPVLTRGFDAE